MKANAYVDGFNLYYGSLKRKPYRFLTHEIKMPLAPPEKGCAKWDAGTLFIRCFGQEFWRG
jgi:hypothetical protein